MDYIEDGPATNLANPSGYLTLHEVVRLGREILRGLEYLHGLDVIHNDIKPENVLIGPEGQGMLTDYGIAGISGRGAPIRASMFYKIHAAPEVIGQNLISVQSDIYQVGLTLFRMLVGIDALRRRFNDLGEQDYYRAVSGPGLLKAVDFPAYVPSRVPQNRPAGYGTRGERPVLVGSRDETRAGKAPLSRMLDSHRRRRVRGSQRRVRVSIRTTEHRRRRL